MRHKILDMYVNQLMKDFKLKNTVTFGDWILPTFICEMMHSSVLEKNFTENEFFEPK